MLESLHNKKIEDEIKSFLERVETGKDKTGIVMNVVEGKPQFVHRTFAEYFTARWFSENFQSNRSVLEHILFDDKYRFVTDMFDRMLAEDCPLHCAVLEWESWPTDAKIFETLLKERWNANAVDKGGRTLMHIIAKNHTIYYKMTDLVDHSGVALDNKDRVLQWTPLQYAIKWERMDIVEWLLQRNVDRSGFDMIRQRAQDTDYIGPIITHAACDGHLLLLKFIHSIGVDILQASSIVFPSPLHAAIQGRQLQVVRWLIKQGADCNIRYSNDQTALHYAVTKGSLDVVRALVEEGGASLDLRDDCGRTAIGWAKYFMSDPKYRKFLNWYVGVEELNETLKYLQERGCKQTSSVWRNNDA
jgi:ankyrin repeat protein